MSSKSKREQAHQAALDMIDRTKGYVPGNVQFVSEEVTAHAGLMIPITPKEFGAFMQFLDNAEQLRETLPIGNVDSLLAYAAKMAIILGVTDFDGIAVEYIRQAQCELDELEENGWVLSPYPTDYRSIHDPRFKETCEAVARNRRAND